MSIESILSTEIHRRSFLAILGSGAAMALVPMKMPSIETGSVLQANIPAEPFYFRSGGRGISEIGEKFATAVQLATGENVHPLIERIIGGFRVPLRSDQGICNGVAAQVALKQGMVPPVNCLAG